VVKIPYKRVGKRIYHRKGGSWKLKQKASSIPKAKSAMNLLYGLESGWKPTGLAAADRATRTRVARMGGKARR
jgi:hypothetical protein